MQLITLLSAAAATIATVSAERNAVDLNKQCDQSKPHARIVNRCDYTVNIWSVLKGDGCPTSQMVTLKKGESYAENYVKASKLGDGRGVSIKVSKTEDCKANDITQLEYFLDDMNTDKAFQLNYLDVSYVDCLAGDCPTKKEGFYLQAGTANVRALRKTTDNSWCPILACHDAASCAKMAYILPDDIQTKTCDFESSMTFYMCGSNAPSEGDDVPASSVPASSAPASSSKKVDTPTPKPSTTAKAPSSAAGDYKVNVAAVTPIAEVKDNKPPKVKTKVVYVTAYEYINAKRSEHGHAHAHARRHQPFHA